MTTMCDLTPDQLQQVRAAWPLKHPRRPSMIGTVMTLPQVGKVNYHIQTEPASVAQLQAIVGGTVREIPGFHSVTLPDGSSHACRAYANEEAPLLIDEPGFAVNRLASLLWKENAPNVAHPLIGNVAVIFGDKGFMEPWGGEAC